LFLEGRKTNNYAERRSSVNRNQRKKLKEDKEKQQWRLKLNRGSKVDCVQTDPDFSAVPLATICQSILLLIKELRRRGFPVYDFDHKNKYLQGIKIIQGKIYFLAAEEEDRT
jgi:hypothetical protein